MCEKKKLVFDFNWKLTLCVVLIFPVLVKLSLWQLDRAVEKEALQASWQARQAQPPVELSFAEVYDDYQRVFVKGVFLPDKYWLKENQMNNGQLGYNVVMPFELPDKSVVVVDRGWVAGSPYRDFVPEVPMPQGSIRVTGVITQPSDSKLIREAETRAKSWPHKVLEVDINVMSKQSELSLYPRLLRLDVDSPGALTVIWRPTNMSAAKHYGYSMQWGLLALALIILYLFASTNLSQLFKANTKD